MLFKEKYFRSERRKISLFRFYPNCSYTLLVKEGRSCCGKRYLEKKREKRITFHGREKSMPLDFIFLSIFEFFINFSLTAPREGEREGRREKERGEI